MTNSGLPNSNLSIATLVGSRICHDLISPVGAIHNGIELIAMGGPVDTPELSLISESVGNASARIKFFRIAFGMASPEQVLGAPEVSKVIADAFEGGRHSTAWQIESDSPRADVQAAFLAILCVESALPRGGEITVTRSGQSYRIAGRGERLACDSALWEPLAAQRAPANLRPAQVEFALLPFALSEMGRAPSTEIGTDSVAITF